MSRTLAIGARASVILACILGCRADHASDTYSPVDLRQAEALRDELNDGMIDTMIQYMSDCDVMARKLNEYLTAHKTEYETVRATLGKIPWPAREPAPDMLGWRLKKADDTVRKMAPASESCRTNQNVIMVMREHFYGDNWKRGI
jgi:hypothetical protein